MQLDLFDTMPNQHKTVPATCARCLEPFEARERDRKRGNGLYCSRRCAASKGGDEAKGSSLAPASHLAEGGPTTDFQAFERFVRARGYSLTLSDFLRSPFAAEYRKYNCWLRKLLGWTYTKRLNKREPGKNLYTYTPPERAAAGAA